MLELDTRIFGAKMPIYTPLLLVTILTPGFEFIAQVFKVGDSAMRKALSPECGKFNFGYVEPTAMFGRVVDFQTSGQRKCLGSRECLI